MSRRPGLLLLCAALLGCVGIGPTREVGPGGAWVVEPIALGAGAREAHWSLPLGEATALVVLEHGFLRHCENLRETTRRLVAVGVMVLCVDASMRGGNPALAERLAHALADDALAPPGRRLPRRILVAGHSAGALFAVRLGAVLDAIAPARLAGALLFDPVAGEGFEAGLRTITDAGRRPVLVLLAPPHRCNARSNGLPALRRIEQEIRGAGSSEFVLVDLDAQATHADVEGEDSSGVAEWACGRVLPQQTERLRALAVEWVRRVVPAAGAKRSESAGKNREGGLPDVNSNEVN